MAIKQYLIQDGTSKVTFTASTISKGPVTTVDFSSRGFDTNTTVTKDSYTCRQLQEYATRRQGTYYTSNFSFSSYVSIKCTIKTDYTDNTNNQWVRVYLYKKDSNESPVIHNGTKGTNYQYVQATKSWSTITITLTDTLKTNCDTIGIMVSSGGSQVNAWIKDLWLERDEYTYTVSYANGGHGTAPNAQTKTEGSNLTLRGAITTTDTYNGPTSYYTVTGNPNGGAWSDSGTKNGSASKTPVYGYKHTKWKATNGTTYDPGGTYSTDAATTMTAVWGQGDLKNTTYNYSLPTNKPTKASSTTDSKIVTFNANGGATSKTSETSSKTVTYTFNNIWKTADGTTRTPASTISADETIFAQYDSTTGSQPSITFPTTAQCTRTGYTLLGWSTSDSATTATYAPGATRVPTAASEIYYAIWKLNSRLFINTSRVTSIKIGTQDVKKLLVNNLTIFEK